MIAKAFKLFLLTVACTVGGCASDLTSSYQSFAFDMWRDDQKAVVLDYKYKSGDRFLAKMDTPNSADQSGFKTTDSSFYGPRATSLYVKWKDENTGSVYAKTLDLLYRLPPTMTRKTLYLMVYGPQLSLYVIPEISPDNRRPTTILPIGPSRYSYLLVRQIYPDSPR